MVRPEGVSTTAWPSVQKTCEALTITFDPWQDGAGRLILAKRKDGLYASDLVVISIPRQVGKTFLIGWIIFALCIIHPRLTVIWTAHRFKLARETFDQMRGMALLPSMQPHVDPKRGITTAAGNEAIRFRNRSRILFGARESGFGLGFTKVGVLVMDEAQRLSQTTMDDLIPTTNAALNPLIILTGTPPRPTDNGDVFRGLRSDALTGESEDVLYIELSADPNADADDLEQLMKANPSVPHRTSMRAIKRMKKALGAESYRREGLGIWDEDGGGAIPYGTWTELVSLDPEGSAAAVLGIDVDQDRMGWIALAWLDAGGDYHVMLANDGEPLEPHLVAGEAARLALEHGVSVAASPTFIEQVEEEGATSVKVTSQDFTAGCGVFADLVNARLLYHGNQSALNRAVKAAQWRQAGSQGEKAFQLRDMPEVGPLAAAVRALSLVSADYDVLDSIY